jgi:6-phosphogluconolactonase
VANAVTAAAEPGPTSAGDRRIVVAADPDALVTLTASALRASLAQAIAARGLAWIALAGGRTPRAVYERLATPGTPAIDWARVHVGFGDERLVPPDHADSNYAMARAALLARVPIPASQVHRMAGEAASAETAAAAYETALVQAFGLSPGGWPVFDLVLLGVGADGHTASLFPGTPALHERARLAVGVEAPTAPSRRITLTYPVLNAAREVVILTAGADKAAAVAHALAVEGAIERCPVRGIRPAAGRVAWHLDAAAASGLPAGIH